MSTLHQTLSPRVRVWLAKLVIMRFVKAWRSYIIYAELYTFDQTTPSYCTCAEDTFKCARFKRSIDSFRSFFHYRHVQCAMPGKVLFYCSDLARAVVTSSYPSNAAHDEFVIVYNMRMVLWRVFLR